jgi:hypothetical protein
MFTDKLSVSCYDFFWWNLPIEFWLQWCEPDRPWVGTDLPCNEIDKQLFRASTVVKVSNGKMARFWDSPWLGGQAPRDIAPALHKLAWKKTRV